MTQIIDLPDGTQAEFPDGMTSQEIEAVLQRQFPTEAAVATQEPEEDTGIVESLDRIITSVAEPALTFATGIAAEPIAGLAGIAQTINPFAEEGAGEAAVQATQQALTFQPRSEAGQAGLEAVGEVLQPVGEFITDVQSGLGDAVFEKTGSPALSALATTAPTAAMEILGFKGTTRLIKNRQAAKAGGATKPIKVTEGQVRKAVKEFSPEPEVLLQTARDAFKEVTDLGGTVRPEKFSKFVDDLDSGLRGRGFRPRTAKEIQGLLDEFKETSRGVTTLDDISELRTVASGLAKNPDLNIQRLALSVMDDLDDFIGTENIISFPGGTRRNVGETLKGARNLWRRARGGETIAEIFNKAELAEFGKFSDTLRTQFRTILNNKKKRKFFDKEELAFMKKVAKGGKIQGLLDFAGKGGLQTNPFFKSAGFGAASLILGVDTAAILPIIGTVSKFMADRLRKGNAEFADAVIRSGKNPEGVINAYLKHTPLKDRVDSDMAQLLIKPNIDLSKVKNPSPFVQSAIQKAEAARAALAAAAVTGAATQEIANQGEQLTEALP